MSAVQQPIGHHMNRFGRARLHRLRKESRNHALPWKSGASATVSQLLFRTFGACSSTTFYPRLAPWAAFLRRFAARIVTCGPLFVQSGGCDTVSSAPRKQFEINERFSAYAVEMDTQRLFPQPVQPCRYVPNENTNFSPWNRARRRKLLLTLVLITLVLLFPTPSHAYAGPGAGFAVLSSFWTLFVAFLYSAYAF